jgi:transposase
MANSITQDMRYRQSLMKYAEKYGVSRASRKYNKSRSYIYFWKQRWDGSVASLACQSRRPHSHPNQHTEDELKLIRDMRRRNPNLGMLELWHRLRKRGYTRCPESLFRVMRKMGLFPVEKPKKKYKPKPYEQMTHPGERVQVDVKVVPRRCIADPELRLFQYTAIDEFTRLRFLAAYPDLPKNDWVDAFVIADHLRFGRIAKEVYMDDYRYQALRTLTRARFDMIQNLTREKQRFANYLFLKCSGIAQDKGIQNTVDEAEASDADTASVPPAQPPHKPTIITTASSRAILFIFIAVSPCFC